MVITIRIQNQQYFQWLAPFLEALKKHSSARVEIQEEPSDKKWQDKLASFFQFVNENAITVDKIEIPDREERNAR